MVVKGKNPKIRHIFKTAHRRARHLKIWDLQSYVLHM